MADALAVLDQLDAALLPAALVKIAARMQATAATDAGADDLLTPDDVAALLRVSKKAVYNRSRELGAVRVGRRLRFPRRSVIRFVARGKR